MLVRQGRVPSDDTSPWTIKMPLYKYVDEADAHFIESGSLKFGTLRGYADLEDDKRRDADEFTARAIIDYADGSNPEHRQRLEASGLVGGNSTGSVIVVNSVMRVSGHNLHCFCASYRDDLDDAATSKQAVFEIPDVEAWLHLIQIRNTDLKSLNVSHVTYQERDKSFLDETSLQPNPFVKSLRFQQEHEVRILTDRPVPNGAAPIFTTPDRHLAKMMRRVR
ncbi:MAG: hypothetical protein PGN16_10725 [Sphingomonas phyllosphaerae]|uniref:hypothetical protein n=1 Tax=Sphingomonas phyllosphaerae TaxID=257003 RepID=UPI002FFBAAFE